MSAQAQCYVLFGQRKLFEGLSRHVISILHCTVLKMNPDDKYNNKMQ